MIMLDLGSGLGGASQVMKSKGWRVICVDINPAFRPDVVADLRRFSVVGLRPDLVWCSPPCDEFSRESMPWSKTGKLPDLSIVRACKRIIQETNPRYWVVENVRGSIPYLNEIFGSYKTHYGPFFLWGNFPELGNFRIVDRKKESYNSKQKAERAKIPAQISSALTMAIESQLRFI